MHGVTGKGIDVVLVECFVVVQGGFPQPGEVVVAGLGQVAQHILLLRSRTVGIVHRKSRGEVRRLVITPVDAEARFQGKASAQRRFRKYIAHGPRPFPEIVAVGQVGQRIADIVNHTITAVGVIGLQDWLSPVSGIGDIGGKLFF